MRRRERVNHQVRHYQDPLPPTAGPDSASRAEDHQQPARWSILIHDRRPGTKNVRVDAEIANGWQPVFFYPERAGERGATPWQCQARQSRRTRYDGGVSVAIGDNVDDRFQWVKPQLALYIGGMGIRAATSITTWLPGTDSAP